MNSDATLIVFEGFDAGYLGDVFLVVRFLGGMVGESNEDAHAHPIRIAPCNEIKAVPGDILCCAGVEKGGFAGIGRANQDGLADLDAARAASFLLAPRRGLHILIKS